MVDETRRAGIDTTLSRRGALVGGSAAGGLLLATAASAQRSAAIIRRYAAPRQVKADHAVVYRRENEFAGWPHTMGFWNLGDGEIVQYVTSLNTSYGSADAISHDNIGRDGGKQVGLRSKDWGRTWDGAIPVINPQQTIARDMANAKTMGDLQPIDFLDRNILISNSGAGFGTPEGRTDVRVSKDRGHSWSPPIPVPTDGLHSISGMNSVLIRPDGTAMIWLMEVDKDGWNRHPCVFALPPRGRDFHFLSFITQKRDPKGEADGDWQSTFRFGGHRWFYPRGYMLPSGRMLCVMRCQRDPRGIMWTEVHASDDGGRTWGFLSRVNDFGSPGSLVRLDDGRLVIVYGNRLMPSGIRATVSTDEGATWGPELIVRDDGGSWDLGYPNAWVTDDGKVGVIYYFNGKDDPKQVNGGVRHICRSIFSVD
ncbi:sialidase family protein [Sphingobium nicotianae]|uniref:Glycoside hydrolase n=1 Tax=Sphingobium nicotianae TaxID=2782607 RepID=A0A9X1DE52_9SPHN|nr:sialidase family protein [Sphingobium nicotianae]MBT2188214.1 glycoside hydrolase [Sphingobium nicotianae]